MRATIPPRGRRGCGATFEALGRGETCEGAQGGEESVPVRAGKGLLHRAGWAGGLAQSIHGRGHAAALNPQLSQPFDVKASVVIPTLNADVGPRGCYASREFRLQRRHRRVHPTRGATMVTMVSIQRSELSKKPLVQRGRYCRQW